MPDTILHDLVSRGAACPDLPSLLALLGALLEARGLGVDRMNLSLATLHPEIVGIGVYWDRERGQGKADLPHGELQTPRFLESPLPRVMGCGESIVRALDPADPKPEFSIFRELAARGFVAYAALPLALAPGRTGAFTVASRRPFGPDLLSTLDGLLPGLALLVELHESRRFSATLLDTYLGHGPGQRVLNGAVRRGDVTGLKAALWYADLRGFTEAALHLSPEQTIAHINAAFEVMVGRVEPAGGDVLKFIGDALLAVFPIEDDGEGAAQRALDAAVQVQHDLAALSQHRIEAGLPAIAAGIALHAGDVQYGNIGGKRRLDFTVIGQAVNLVSRIEGQCAALAQPILASRAFVDLAPGDWRSVGEHPLKGFPGRFGLFAPGAARPVENL